MITIPSIDSAVVLPYGRSTPTRPAWISPTLGRVIVSYVSSLDSRQTLSQQPLVLRFPPHGCCHVVQRIPPCDPRTCRSCLLVVYAMVDLDLMSMNMQASLAALAAMAANMQISDLRLGCSPKARLHWQAGSTITVCYAGPVVQARQHCPGLDPAQLYALVLFCHKGLSGMQWWNRACCTTHSYLGPDSGSVQHSLGACSQSRPADQV